MQQEEIPAETWEAWNRLLTPSAQLQLRSTRGGRGSASKPALLKPEDQLPALHALALELRDRLRFSQRRTEELKAEVVDAEQETEAERQYSASRFRAFEAEIDRLKQGVSQQSAALDTHASLTWQLQTDLAQAQAQVQAAQEALQQANIHAAHELQQAKMQAAEELQQANTRAAHDLQQANMHTANEVQQAKMQTAEEIQRVNMHAADAVQQANMRAADAEARASLAETRAAEAEARAADAEVQRVSVLEELNSVSSQVDDIAAHAENQGRTQADLMSALVASKTRLSEMAVLEGLYCEARDELKRLDKENLELKDMWQKGASELGKSRILEAVPAGSLRHASPNVLAAYTGSKKAATKRPNSKKKSGWIHDCICDGGLSPVGRCSPTRNPPGPSGLISSDLPGMAFLGPSSRDYPPDPEQYIYLRIGGGYNPKHVGTKEIPKASGWVPKDVVKVVQAFRHAYKLHAPDWIYWEPLLLLIDEVYRAQKLAPVMPDARARHQKVDPTMAPEIQMPGVVQSARIAGMRQQLDKMRRNMGLHETRDSSTLKKIAEKEYHLTNQLDAAIEQNVQLRRQVGGR